MAYPFDLFGSPFGGAQPQPSGGFQGFQAGSPFGMVAPPPAAAPAQFGTQFLSGASPGFMGLQGLQPGFDPSSLDFNQLSQLLALTSGAPQRIDQFQQQGRQQIGRLGQAGSRAIEQGAAQQFSSQANQLGAQQRQTQAQQGDAFAAMGLAPSIFQTSVVPQQQMDLASMLGQARGATSAGATAAQQGLREDQFGRRMGLSQEVLNARNQLEQYYDSLLLQKYMAEIAAQAQMSAAGKKAKSDQFGDILGLGGAILGGPIGGGIGKFLGGLF